MSKWSTKSYRSWLAWTIVAVWAVTALAVWISTRIHPATTANISLNVKQFSFRTNASHFFGPGNEEQLLVSGLSTLRIQFDTVQTVKIGGQFKQVSTLEIQGGPYSSCSFYQVRTSGFELAGPVIVKLDKLDINDPRSFGLQANGPLSANLSSRPGEGTLKSGFECKEVNVEGRQRSDVEGIFSPKGGDSIYVATSSDPRLDFVTASHSEIGDSQIPILEEVRFSEIDPMSGEEKSVLLEPPPEIIFERLDKKVTVRDADLLLVAPKTDLYLRRFTIEKGIQLSLHGMVREIMAGAGPSDLKTVMPSFFEHLDSAKRIFGVIPALVALLLGIVEKMADHHEK